MIWSTRRINLFYSSSELETASYTYPGAYGDLAGAADFPPGVTSSPTSTCLEMTERADGESLKSENKDLWSQIAQGVEPSPRIALVTWFLSINVLTRWPPRFRALQILNIERSVSVWYLFQYMPLSFFFLLRAGSVSLYSTEQEWVLTNLMKIKVISRSNFRI